MRERRSLRTRDEGWRWKEGRKCVAEWLLKNGEDGKEGDNSKQELWRVKAVEERMKRERKKVGKGILKGRNGTERINRTTAYFKDVVYSEGWEETKGKR